MLALAKRYKQADDKGEREYHEDQAMDLARPFLKGGFAGVGLLNPDEAHTQKSPLYPVLSDLTKNCKDYTDHLTIHEAFNKGINKEYDDIIKSDANRIREAAVGVKVIQAIYSLESSHP
jgi:hypothetical protein